MYQMPDYTDISLSLSEVLNEIGLNETLLTRRRRAVLLMEKVNTIGLKLRNTNTSAYRFGSQSEGTTTRGLKSDSDVLLTVNEFRAIQDWREWKAGEKTFLMVRSEDVSPGYCLLQRARTDVPLPETLIFNSLFYVNDKQGRLLLKSNFLKAFVCGVETSHGPAFTHPGQPGRQPVDRVLALRCESALPEVHQWLSQLQGSWPTDEMKEYIANCPCFVVPVGSKGNANEELEWRISTSPAERCLMLNLNETQLQVYVLMKMLSKTIINCYVPEENHVSSFMCKTVLLHCVQNTDHRFWKRHKLIPCLMYSMSMLYACIINDCCPHVIMQSNNLMAGRFSSQAKYQILENFRQLFEEFVPHLSQSLHFDDISRKLQAKLNQGLMGTPCRQSERVCQKFCWSLLKNCAAIVRREIMLILSSTREIGNNQQIDLLRSCISTLVQIHTTGNEFERIACDLLTRFLCTAVGSLIASSTSPVSVSAEALTYFSFGIHSDVASSLLKLASVFYSTGDIEKTKVVLDDVQRKYDLNVCDPVCACDFSPKRIKLSRIEAFAVSNERDIPRLTASCVVFLPSERICMPQELQYEMHRSTSDDLVNRDEEEDFWMNWAVVDSLTYLHFLQYKTYGRLQKRGDQQRALYNLKLAIQSEPRLSHRETALNLLGQCYEQENMWNDALQCYSWSLCIRSRNNAANFHILSRTSSHTNTGLGDHF